MIGGLEVAFRCDAQLGETPVWSPEDEILYWIDIEGRAVNAYSPTGGVKSGFEVPELIGCIGLAPTGFVLAIGGDIVRSGPDGTPMEMTHTQVFEDERVRFNDGRVDRYGRLYVGTMDLRERDPLGGMYLINSDGTSEMVLDSLVVSNGLDFSLDGTHLFHIDSSTQGVDVYKIDAESGRLSHRSRLFEVPKRFGEPDGLVIDAENCLWMAMWGGGKVVRFDLSGKVLEQVDMPVSQPTGITFGGEELDQLYICSARAGLNPVELHAQPLSGSLFCLDAGVVGIASNRFGVSR
ncbi:MAG: SMP-30/gluconolactonase/LRE family protein [Acidimicrobiaceae bacterium]|nr:SMP-30/gluconolactonase/LRE family protein [Acidimicrobiaceae bacterium]